MMKRFLLAIAVAAALTACNEPKLVIIHTNDTHSHLDPLRAGENAGHGGIIERAAFVDSIRTRYGEGRVLLLHDGDFNQGSSYYTELGGSVEVDEVNAMKYDCITLGNHELDNGLEDLAERVSRIKCEVVCSNCDFSSMTLGQYVKPYTVISRAGMKIGIVGLISDIATMVSREISSRIPVLDNVEVTNKWARYLKKDLGCDMVILLSHLGYGEDLEFVPKTRNVDLVIGGHSHTFVKDFKYVRNADGKKVPIITDGCWGLEMGEIKVY